LPARHTITTGLQWRSSPDWALNLLSTSVLGRQRPAGDPREAAKNYTTVATTVEANSVFDMMDITFSIRNLFNTDARIQSDSALNVPYDIPLPGREAIISVKTHW
jgi:outer membrane receptor protein involved in Fe transport